uniref:FTH domain-containing protein n=1 Tax=Caenorhabditis tropicalis TaxID=1561998 RepID=A0A1I7TBA1_9PELO
MEMAVENSLDGEPTDKVFINGREYTLEMLTKKYFRFWNKVAHLKMQQLRVQNASTLTVDQSESFHEAIHSQLIGDNWKSMKTLTGMEVMCNGCSKCQKLIEIVEEYGPIGIETIKKIENPVHFKKLIVTDGLLDEIANHCVQESSSKTECFQRLDSFLDSPIKTDTLAIYISETRELNEDQKHQSMPREVLETFIHKWNPHSIRIHFIYSTLSEQYNNQWSGYFQPLRLTDPFESVSRSSFPKFKEVQLDLLESIHCSDDIQSLHLRCQLNGYENVLACIRRVFPTDKISIKNLYYSGSYMGRFISMFDNLHRFVQFEKQEHLTVDVDYFMNVTCFDMLKYGITYESDSKPRKEFSKFAIQPQRRINYYPAVLNGVIPMKGFSKTKKFKWIGKEFQIGKDSFQLNINAWLVEKNFKRRKELHKKDRFFFKLFE